MTEWIRQVLAGNCLSGFARHSPGTDCRFIHIARSCVFVFRVLETRRPSEGPEGNSKMFLDVSGACRSSLRSCGGWKVILSRSPMISDLTRVFEMSYGGVAD